MKSCHLIAATLLLLSAGFIHAEKAELTPPLDALATEILQMFPEASELQISGARSFTISHQTQEFMVHNINMTGEISEKPHKTIGPSFKGAIFKISILDEEAAVQAVTPQTLRKPYWSSYINHLKFEGYSLFYSFEYGSRTDRKLIHAVTQKVNSLPRQNPTGK